MRDGCFPSYEQRPVLGFVRYCPICAAVELVQRPDPQRSAQVAYSRGELCLLGRKSKRIRRSQYGPPNEIGRKPRPRCLDALMSENHVGV